MVQIHSRIQLTYLQVAFLFSITISPSYSMELAKSKEELNNDFLLACANNDLAIAEELLWQGADVNAQHHDGLAGLHMAAHRGSKRLVKLLLARGADIHKKHNAFTPLDYAALLCRTEIIDVLLAKGANHNNTLYNALLNGLSKLISIFSREFDDKHSPTLVGLLHAAAQDGHEHIVKFILKKVVDGNAVDSEGHTVLYNAIIGGSLDMVTLLMRNGASDKIVRPRFRDYSFDLFKDMSTDEWHNSPRKTKIKHIEIKNPLLLAARYGHKELVSFFLSRINIEACDEDHRLLNDRCMTALNFAAYYGHKETVEFLLERGAQFNQRTLYVAARSGLTKIVEHLLKKGLELNQHVLKKAARSGNKEIVEFLLNNGVVYDQSALHMATRHGHKNVVEFLLNNGAKIDQETLHIAAAYGHKTLVELSLENGVHIDVQDSKGKTPLHTALEQYHPDVASFLIANGASVHLQDKNGRTVLHLASVAGLEEIIESLLEKGANINAQDREGATPLYVAASCRHFDSVKFLLMKGANIHLEDNNGRTLLHAVVRMGQKKTIESLLWKGADINAQDRYGNAPLHIANYFELSVVEFLLARGAKADIEDKECRTPFHKAAQDGHKGLVDCFLKNGIDINQKSSRGITALFWAALEQKEEMVNYLISLGADLTLQDVCGFTPFCWSVWNGRKKFESFRHDTDAVPKLLLSKGADINAKDKSGTPLLVVATEQDNVKMVKLLLALNADECATDTEGCTALHRAVEKGNMKLIQLLLTRRSIVQKDNEGLTPLHFAACKGDEKIFEYLLMSVEYSDHLLRAKSKSGYTSLHMAVKNNHGMIVERLLLFEQKAASKNNRYTWQFIGSKSSVEPRLVDIADEGGKTPLHTACQNGNTKIVALLLSNGAKNDVKDQQKATPLYYAIVNGSIDIIKLLVAHGANDEVKDHLTALQCALWKGYQECGIWCGYQEIIKAGLEEGSQSYKEMKDSIWGTLIAKLLSRWEDSDALHCNVKQGYKEIVEFLLAQGAPLRLKSNFNSETALHIAAQKGYKRLVELLLSKNASIDLANGAGETPLFLAAKEAGAPIVELLLTHGADVTKKTKGQFTALHCACDRWSHSSDVIRLLLKSGANLNEKDGNGDRPLHHAVKSRKSEIVNLLLDAGANINEKNDHGDTPFHFAVSQDNEEIINLLIKAGTQISEKNNQGSTPLHLAALHGKKDVVKLLIEAGAHVSAKDDQGKTPWQVAKDMGHEAIAEFAALEDTQTALHFAATEGYREIVKLLIERKVDINAQEKEEGFTALHCAAAQGHSEIVKLLLEKGAGINVTDKMGWTALSWALAKKQEKIVELLLAHGADSNIGYEIPHKLGTITIEKSMVDLLNEGKMAQCIADLLKKNKSVRLQDFKTYLYSHINSRFLRDTIERLLDAQTHDESHQASPALPSTTVPAISNYIDTDYAIRLEDNYTEIFQSGLAIDGEGLQALITATMVKKLEDELQKPLHELFDWISGSSFGGIVALSLIASEDGFHRAIKPRELIKMFECDSEKFFPAKLKKNGIPYKLNFLQQKFRELFKKTQLCNALTRIVIPCERNGELAEFDSKSAQKEVASNGNYIKGNYCLSDIACSLAADGSGAFQLEGNHFNASKAYVNSSAAFLNTKLNRLIISSDKTDMPPYRLLYCVANPLDSNYTRADSELSTLNEYLTKQSNQNQQSELTAAQDEVRSRIISQQEREFLMEQLAWKKQKTTINYYTSIKAAIPREDMPKIDDKKIIEQYKELGEAAAKNFINNNEKLVRLLKENADLKNKNNI